MGGREGGETNELEATLIYARISSRINGRYLASTRLNATEESNERQRASRDKIYEVFSAPMHRRRIFVRSPIRSTYIFGSIYVLGIALPRNSVFSENRIFLENDRRTIAT